MSETNDMEVTRGVSLPSVWLLEIGAYPLGCRRLENGIMLNFALPCFPPIVSGLGKQEIAFRFCCKKLYLSFSLIGVLRMVLLTRDWPIFKT